MPLDASRRIPAGDPAGCLSQPGSGPSEPESSRTRQPSPSKGYRTPCQLTCISPFPALGGDDASACRQVWCSTTRTYLWKLLLFARGEVHEPVDPATNANGAPGLGVVHEELRRIACLSRLLSREQTLLARRYLEEAVPVRAVWQRLGHAQNVSQVLVLCKSRPCLTGFTSEEGGRREHRDPYRRPRALSRSTRRPHSSRSRSPLGSRRCRRRRCSLRSRHCRRHCNRWRSRQDIPQRPRRAGAPGFSRSPCAG
jgi:hypothetical protein